MGTMLQDIRYGLQNLAKDPGFAAVAALTLALGIGANTTVFAFLYALLFPVLPVAEPERVVFVWGANQQGGVSESDVSLADFRMWREQSRSFAACAAYAGASYNLSGGDEAVRVLCPRVTCGFFSFLGAQPALGRTPRPEEHHVVVLSHGLWQWRFGADRAVLGKTAGTGRDAGRGGRRRRSLASSGRASARCEGSGSGNLCGGPGPAGRGRPGCRVRSRPAGDQGRPLGGSAT